MAYETIQYEVREGVAIAAIRAAFERDLAGPLGMSVEEAAEAVIRLGNVHMTGAIRMVSLSRGYDPRDFVLFAFGGAGPLHAVALARELGIPEVLVPARPGLTNALGLMVNYVYRPQRIEENHELYTKKYEIAATTAIESLARKA